MKHIKLINEYNSDRHKQDFTIIKDKLIEECSEAIDLMKKNGPLYRGVTNPINVILNNKMILGFYERVPRVNRRPLDMMNDISDLLDKSFYKKFGVKLRSESVFATFDSSVAGEYSGYSESEIDYIIFPVDGFDYYTNTDISDLYTAVKYRIWYQSYRYYCNAEKNNDLFYKGIKLNIESNFESYLDEHSYTYQELFQYLKENSDEFNLTNNETHLYDKDNNSIIMAHGVKKILDKKPKLTSSEFDEYRMDQINKFVENYTKNADLDPNNTHKKNYRNELSIICDKYYLVDSRYIDELNELVNYNNLFVR